jgi:hypothetical protein
VRNSLPRLLLAVLVVVAGAGATLGALEAGGVPAAHRAETPAAQQPVLVGMSLAQALGVARRDGITVRLWRRPDSAPAGTVIQQLSYQPVFLVVSSGPLKDRYAVLPGAAVPPVGAECAAGFALQPDGNAGPATCGAGHVDVATWDYFAASTPPMLAVGRAATACEVARSYDDQFTPAMNRTVYELAQAYYGWRFGPAFAASLGRPATRARACGST